MRRGALIWSSLVLVLLVALVGTRHTHDADHGLAPRHECTACAWRIHATAVVAPVELASPPSFSIKSVPAPADPVLPRQFSVATAIRGPPTLRG
ncbi:hypothetical protein HQ590_14230 [bacterium]|nr:hypothetical protein [bacterium]